MNVEQAPQGKYESKGTNIKKNLPMGGSLRKDGGRQQNSIPVKKDVGVNGIGGAEGFICPRLGQATKGIKKRNL